MTKIAGIAELLLGVGVLLLAVRAWAQDADQVALLKAEIQGLEEEIGLLTGENALLKNENEQLRSGGAKGAKRRSGEPGSDQGLLQRVKQALRAPDKAWEATMVS